MELLKNVIHMPFTNTQNIGEVANFISGSIFVLTTTLIYLRFKNKKGVILSLGLGTVALVIATSFVNYFFTIPLYEKVMGFPLSVIIEMCDVANTLLKIDSKLDVILMTFVPFNIFKGITISMVAFLCYMPLRRFFEDKAGKEVETEGSSEE